MAAFFGVVFVVMGEFIGESFPFSPWDSPTPGDFPRVRGDGIIKRRRADFRSPDNTRAQHTSVEYTDDPLRCQPQRELTDLNWPRQ